MVQEDRQRTISTAKGQTSRAAILEAAEELFAERGYRGSSLAMVSRAVGLTQPGLLHHFPSKEHLLRALLDERYHADGRVRTSRDATGLQLFEVLATMVEHNAVSPGSTKLFAVLAAEGLAAEHPAHEYFVERYRKVRQRMARDLRAGQATGEIDDEVDVSLVAAVVVAVMDGLQSQWLLDDEVDMTAAFRLFCDTFVSALSLDRPPREDPGAAATAG